MEGLIVRTATKDDLATLFRFEQGVIAAERPFDPTLKAGEIHYYDLAGMIEVTHIALMVAELGGRLIGSGYARMEESKPYLQHTRHAYLGFMYVEPEFRGKGVNKAIMDALEKWSLEQGITELRLDVYAGNLPAVKAYEKAGFSSLLVEMRKELKKRG